MCLFHINEILSVSEMNQLNKDLSSTEQNNAEFISDIEPMHTNTDTSFEVSNNFDNFLQFNERFSHNNENPADSIS